MKIKMINRHDSYCEVLLNQKLDDELFCLQGALQGQGMCRGDIGGPAIDDYKGRLLGISVGDPLHCGNGGKPDVFLEVAVLEPFIRANVPGLANKLWKWY